MIGRQPDAPRIIRQIGTLFFTCLFVAGCGSVLQVTKRPGLPVSPTDDPPVLGSAKSGGDEQLPGVPFYAVGYRCLHTSIWLEPVYRVTVIVLQTDGKAVTSETKYFGRKEFNSESTQDVLGEIRAVSQLPAIPEYNNLLSSFQQLESVDPLEFDTKKIPDPRSKERTEVLLAGNFTAPERYVDTSALFYYNVKKPFAGSANGEIDLTNEGIISKTSGQVTEQTAQTILSTLPISDLIKTAATAGISEFNPSQQPAGGGQYKISFELQTTIYKHTHSVATSSVPPCAAADSVVGADGKGNFNFTMEDVTTPAIQAPAKPAANSDNSKTDSGGR